ncbi:type VII toxin-antitoxin system HepT family RNase toxin [Neomoorella thermoacetica]|uniref:type VII toxin-antitoxin system HepT family RNase toxin n=1 Tax=Neomoorella thermoacetica TaxID=1525 RepID=UPI00214A9DFA|nr:HepT-like ribonuclease domain-containing protein [Moorella thermoacetica]
MELAITCIMDIGNHIISAMDLPEPETYADIPISQELARKLSGAVRFRNILAHEYMDIDRRLVYKHLQTGLGDLVEFIYGIGKFLGI